MYEFLPKKVQICAGVLLHRHIYVDRINRHDDRSRSSLFIKIIKNIRY